MHDHSQRALALVGPGRAGTTVAAALVARGWTCVAVAGRSPDAASTLAAADRLSAPVVSVADAGLHADLVVIGTPDHVIAGAASELAARVRTGALVVHLSGAGTGAELEKLHLERPDVEIGSLHPLQSLPSVDLGLARLAGSWCAIDGPEAVDRLALSLGMRPFRVDADQRVRYHAAATIASNHLVALLGQATRIADEAGVPPSALLPLVRATLDNLDALGPAGALTGPVARGDAETVARHLAELAASERPAYRALAEQALRLTGRDDPAVRHALTDPNAQPGRAMSVVETVAELRDACERARANGLTVGFVPTMGYFHEGHRSLMRAARAANDVVVVSLFVNPTQFAPTEDLAAYPRDPDGDVAAAQAEGVDVLFTPSVAEMYPDGGRTTVHVEGLTEVLCGASRPGHFDGVTTIVAKLFAAVGPCRAYFGRKDAQQLAVIRRMTRDLDLPVEVIGCPLVREADGLAMSSRNAYLSPDDRLAALALWRALSAASDAVLAGEREAAALRALLQDALGAAPGVQLDYAAVVDATNLEPVDRIEADTLVALAAFVGKARLIDNVTISVSQGRASVDLGLLTAGSSEDR